MITYVDVPQSDGTTVRCNMKLAVEQANGEEIETRFARAGSAPIYQGALFQLLGYKIDTDTAIEQSWRVDSRCSHQTQMSQPYSSLKR